MAKTSVIEMIRIVKDMAARWTVGGGTFTTVQLQSYVEDETGVKPGVDWMAMQLSEKYDLIAGLWQRKQPADSE